MVGITLGPIFFKVSDLKLFLVLIDFWILGYTYNKDIQKWFENRIFELNLAYCAIDKGVKMTSRNCNEEDERGDLKYLAIMVTDAKWNRSTL